MSEPPQRLPLPAALTSAAGFLRDGRLAEAEDACRAFLRRERRSPEAHHLLSLVALARGEAAEAARLARRGLSGTPAHVPLLVTLARSLMFTGDLPGALSAATRATDHAPTHAVACAQVAEVLERAGHLDDARAALAPALSAAATSAEVARIQALLLLRSGNAADSVRALRPHTKDGSRDAEALFMLGRAHDRLGNYAEAFDAWTRANAAAPGVFDASEFRNGADRIQAAFRAEHVGELPRANGDGAPIFILSMPRSGSTLLERMLSAHPSLTGVGESNVVPGLVRRLAAGYPDGIERLDPRAIERLAQRGIGEWRAMGGSGRPVDKHLGLWRWAGFAWMLWPNARFIVLERDPVETCLSCFMNPLAPRVLPYTTRLEDLAVATRILRATLDHWKSVLGAAVTTLRYEDLVNSTERELRRTLEFCGIPWDDRCLRFHETAAPSATMSYDQVRRPVNKDGLGRAAHYAAELRTLRDILDGSAPGEDTLDPGH